VPARVAELALARLHLLDAVNRARRGGRRWYHTEGDGVAYSYSVFDSYRQVADACERGRDPRMGSSAASSRAPSSIAHA
jgi:hypothetical protein